MKTIWDEIICKKNRPKSTQKPTITFVKTKPSDNEGGEVELISNLVTKEKPNSIKHKTFVHTTMTVPITRMNKIHSVTPAPTEIPKTSVSPAPTQIPPAETVIMNFQTPSQRVKEDSQGKTDMGKKTSKEMPNKYPR